MKFRPAVLATLCGLLLLPLFCLAGSEGAETVPIVYQPLIERLTQDGFDPPFLSTLFLDGRAEPIPARLTITLVSPEVPDLYAPFMTAESILTAKRFLGENSTLLKDMEKGFQVDQEVVVAILLVESRFGENIGKWRVLPNLASMAIADAPENLQTNYESLRETDPALSYERVEGAAKKRAKWAYQELKCFLKIIRDETMDPLEIRGSYAGALGMAQFIPSSYLTFAWRKKGLENWLLSKEEAIYSIANYLKSNGWRKDLPLEKKKRVLWSYNRSQSYVETIVKIAEKLKPDPPRKTTKNRPNS